MRRRVRLSVKVTGSRNYILAIVWAALGVVFFASLFSPQVHALIDSTGLFSREAPGWFCQFYPCEASRLLPYPLEIMLLVTVGSLIAYAAFLVFAAILGAAVLFALLRKASPGFPAPIGFLTRVMQALTKVISPLAARARDIGGALFLAVPLLIAAVLLSYATGNPVYQGPPDGYGGLFYIAHASLFFAFALRAVGIKLQME